MQTFEQVETLLYLFNDFKACINYTEGIRARLISRHNPRNSHTRTLKDSGTPGFGNKFPRIIDMKAKLRPRMSSDLIVSNSWSVYAAPNPSSAQTSISPKRCPPCFERPPSGCCVTNE